MLAHHCLPAPAESFTISLLPSLRVTRLKSQHVAFGARLLPHLLRLDGSFLLCAELPPIVCMDPCVRGHQFVFHLGKSKLSDCWVVWQAHIWFCRKLLDHLAGPPATNQYACRFTSSQHLVSGPGLGPFGQACCGIALLSWCPFPRRHVT